MKLNLPIFKLTKPREYNKKMINQVKAANKQIKFKKIKNRIQNKNRI